MEPPHSADWGVTPTLFSVFKARHSLSHTRTFVHLIFQQVRPACGLDCGLWARLGAMWVQSLRG